MEFVGALILVVFALAIVALLGHGLWVVMALVFRGIFGVGEKPRDTRHAPPEHVDPSATDLAALVRLQRHLQRLRDEGALETEAVGQLLEQIELHRRRVMAGRWHPASSTPAAIPAPLKPAGEPQPIVLELVEEPTTPPIAQPVVPPPVVQRPVAALPVAEPLVAKPESPRHAVSRPIERPRAAAPAPPPSPPPPPEPPAPPRQRFAEILSGFMEERNIRWGELVGGLLFVGGSIALVISLWEKLQEIPYFQFFIFVAVSAAMFGVGLYTHHRWKLASTSQGLLIIATLLVPLNFAVMAGTSRAELNLIAVLLQVAALAIFVALVSLAARVLVGPWRWWMTLAVVGSSACLLLTPSEPKPAMFFLLAALPAACHGVPLGRVLLAEGHEPRWDEARVNRLFVFLGTATFALTVALGLLVVRSVDRPLALDYLSVFVALAAATIAAGGLAIMRGTAESDELAGYRTAGTAVALVGMIVLVVAVGLAWPHPLLLLAVGTLDAVALTVVAFRYRLPAAHALAIACAALVYLVGFHLLWGNLADVPYDELGRKMLELALTAQSGTSLVGFFLLLGVLTEVIARAGRRDDAAIYAGGCVVVAANSLLLVTTRGYSEGGVDALRALIVYGIYGSGSLALNARWRSPLASYVGLVLLVCASLWALWWRDPHLTQLWAALVALESLLLAVLATALARNRTDGTSSLVDAYRWPLRHVADGLVVLAIGLSFAAPELTASWLPTLSAAALAASVLLSAWEYQQPSLSLAGAGLVLAALVHSFVFRHADLFAYPWTAALLAHATLAVTATLALRMLLRGEPDESVDLGLRERVHTVFSEPIGASGLASSLVGLLSLLWFAWSDPLAIAQCLYWLAALWLVLAVSGRSQPLFSAFQAVLALAVGFMATHWLNGQSWVIEQTAGLADPRSLQTYGICLGVLCLLWTIVRIATRNIALARELLNPRWPAVDRVLMYGLVAGSVLLAAWGVLPEVGRELARTALTPRPVQGAVPAVVASVRAAVFGPGAWWLAGVLASTLIVALWDRWRAAEALTATALAIGAACLVAGRFDVQLAVASSLRWNLSTALLLLSIVLWFRAPLAAALRGARCRLEIGAEGPVLTRGLLWIGCVLPVVWLTARVAWLGFQRAAPAGPLAGSVFAEAGLVANNIVPLVLVALALAGHAVRELSPEYAFAAGLVTEVTVAGGYALGVVTGGESINQTETVRIAQLATLAAAVWAIGWLAARRPLIARRPQSASPLADVFLRLQLAQSAVGNLLLLVVAFLLLAVPFDRSEAWTIEAGSPLGWIALVAAVGAGSFRSWQKRRRLRPETVGLLGMAALGLVACSIARALPDTAWGYRALMFGWAAYALSVVAATWWAAVLYAPAGAWGAPRELVRTAAIWVRLSGSLAVLLGLNVAVFYQEDTYWAAGAIGVASAAGAAMAVWLRREGWAFTAGLGVNLAASLAVWHWLRLDTSGVNTVQWWVWLGQANVIAGSIVALLWLAARRRLYADRGLSLADGPLLVLQIALVAAGEACLVAAPLTAMLSEPRGLEAIIRISGGPFGWVAWALALAAVSVDVWQTAARQLLHVLCAFALAAGVLVACSLAGWRNEAWLAYHTLTAAWTVLGATVLGVLWINRSALRSDAVADAVSGASRLAGAWAPSIAGVESWLSLIGLAVVGLAVRGAWDDPQAPYWSAGAVLAVSAIAAATALLVNRPRYVYVSGLLLNVAGSVIWLAWPERTPLELALVNAACFSAAAIIWTTLGLALVPVASAEDRGWPRYEQLSTQAALAILAVVVTIALAGDALDVRAVVPETLAWTAWGLAAAAALLSLWDARATYALAAVYASGAIGIGVELARRELSHAELGWRGGLELAALVLVAAVAARAVGSLAGLGRMLGLPPVRRPLATQWFSPAQGVLTVAAAALGVWMALDFSERMDRLGGAAAMFMLLPAAVLTARDGRGGRRKSWEDAAIALSVMTLASLGCAWLEPTGPARWLHYGVVLLAAASVMIAVSGLGLARLPERLNAWTETGRRSVPALSLLVLIALAAVLVQEWQLFEPWPTRHPMAPWAIAVVAVVLSVLVAVCLAFAVLPRRDPWQLSERGRTLYVYAAEAIALVIVGHFRLTVPRLFQLGIIENYWTLLVMFVAFVGAGLAEWFQRRKLPVLAEPLARTAMLAPLIPAIGHWYFPAVQIGGETVLFLVATFYGFLALTRRSFVFGGLSVIAANLGLWVLWTRLEIQFFEHPQLWLIPIALAGLVAEQFNRGRLSAAQSNAIRYLGLAVIYVSSTADIFIARVASAHFVPMVLVLMLLSVLGVLVGILLRVRSFLYLGVAFLLVDLCTMIYHATVDLGHTWVLWFAVILVGTLIIALFAFFEKRRNDLLAALERFKEWE